jgi:hypothetical protein
MKQQAWTMAKQDMLLQFNSKMCNCLVPDSLQHISLYS